MEISKNTDDFQKFFPNILCSCIQGMALLKYLMLKWLDTTKTISECLPDASGPLVITMPSGSITAANSTVVKVLEHPETKKRRGEYWIYATKERAEIGKKSGKEFLSLAEHWRPAEYRLAPITTLMHDIIQLIVFAFEHP